MCIVQNVTNIRDRTLEKFFSKFISRTKRDIFKKMWLLYIQLLYKLIKLLCLFEIFTKCICMYTRFIYQNNKFINFSVCLSFCRSVCLFRLFSGTSGPILTGLSFTDDNIKSNLDYFFRLGLPRCVTNYSWISTTGLPLAVIRSHCGSRSGMWKVHFIE